MLKRFLIAAALALASTASWAGIFQTINVKTITTEPSGTCSNAIFPASTVFMAVDSLKACSCQAATWVCEAYGASAGAPTTATYLTQTANGTLSGEQALSALASCLIKNTTATGVVSCYAGASCGANTFATSVDLLGAWTCTQPSFANLSGAATDAQIPNNITVDLATLATTATTANAVAANSVTGAGIALGSDAQGDIMFYNGTDYVRLAPGTSGQFLKTQGAAANPVWATAAGTGDVVGPAAATANGITRYSGTTGKLVKDAPNGSTLDDAGLLQTNTLQTLCTAASGDCVYDSTVNTAEPVEPAANHLNLWPFGAHWYNKHNGSTTTEVLMLDNEIVSGDVTVDNAGVVTIGSQKVKPSSLASTAALSGVKYATADSADATKFIWSAGPSVSIPKHTECFTLYDRTALQTVDDIPSIWRAPVAITVTGVWCEGDEATGTVINFQRDDGSPANLLSANMTCTTTPSTGTLVGGESVFAAGDRLDLAIITVAGTPAKQLHTCVEFTFN